MGSFKTDYRDDKFVVINMSTNENERYFDCICDARDWAMDMARGDKGDSYSVFQMESTYTYTDT